MLWIKCLWFPPNPCNPQWDGVRRRGLWEAGGLDEALRVEPSGVGFVPIWERPRGAPSASHLRDTERTAACDPGDSPHQALTPPAPWS